MIGYDRIMFRALLILCATVPLVGACGSMPESKIGPSTALVNTTKQSDESNSTLRPWRSADGRYELRIPKHWYQSTSEEDRDIATAIESANGHSAGNAGRKTLLNIRSSKEGHFATFLLIKMPYEGVDQDLVSRMTEADLRVLENGIKAGYANQMQRIQGDAGFTIVSWSKASFIRVNSMRGWTIGFKFTTEGSSAEWYTSIVYIPINGQLIEMTSAYDISKVTLAKPTLSSIVNSFKMRRQ